MARRFADMIAALFVVAFGVLAGAPAACLGTLASHQPGHLGRAAIGALAWVSWRAQVAGTFAAFALAAVSLPRKRMAAGALFVDGLGRVLLVDPVYRGTWDLPGGGSGIEPIVHLAGCLRHCIAVARP